MSRKFKKLVVPFHSLVKFRKVKSCISINNIEEALHPVNRLMVNSGLSSSPALIWMVVTASGRCTCYYNYLSISNNNFLLNSSLGNLQCLDWDSVYQLCRCRFSNG